MQHRSCLSKLVNLPSRSSGCLHTRLLLVADHSLQLSVPADIWTRCQNLISLSYKRAASADRQELLQPE